MFCGCVRHSAWIHAVSVFSRGCSMGGLKGRSAAHYASQWLAERGGVCFPPANRSIKHSRLSRVSACGHHVHWRARLCFWDTTCSCHLLSHDAHVSSGLLVKWKSVPTRLVGFSQKIALWVLKSVSLLNQQYILQFINTTVMLYKTAHFQNLLDKCHILMPFQGAKRRTAGN